MKSKLNLNTIPPFWQLIFNNSVFKGAKNLKDINFVESCKHEKSDANQKDFDSVYEL